VSVRERERKRERERGSEKGDERKKGMGGPILCS